MTLGLNDLKYKKAGKRRSKRVGRGNASGKGNYSTRGLKGQRARAGGRGGLKLKGLRPRLLQIPKVRGFKSNKPKPAVVNVGDLNKIFKGNEMVTPRALMAKGLVGQIQNGVKILGKGELDKKLKRPAALLNNSYVGKNYQDLEN